MKKQLLNIVLLLATVGSVKAQVSFAPAVNYLAGSGPQSVISADFNSDGKIDLVATNANFNDVSLLLGNGAGSFASAVSFFVGGNPVSVAAADFNGDGKLDLATANTCCNNVSVLFGNGAGSFAAPIYFAVGSLPQTVTAADFNGDSKIDLATANGVSNNVSILLGNGAGSFAAAVNFAVGSNSRSLVTSDFNGDGKMDLATANANNNNVSTLLGDGAGGFAAAVNFAVGSSPRFVTGADFNGDGKIDLAVANYNSNNVSVLLGNGVGSFSTAVNFAAGTNPYSIASADFNADGNIDLAVGNSGGNSISMLLGNGVGSFAAPVNYAVNTPNFLTTSDFNGDSKVDLATANAGSNNVSVLLNNLTAGATLNFDGANDFVNIPNNSSFNFGTNDFTIETYAKTSSIAGNQVMIGKINGGNNFWFGVSNGKANFSLIGGPDALGTSTIGDGNWHHLAAVRQSGVVSLYVDGVLEATQNNTGNATINGNLTLGNFNGGFNFPGSLDEVRLWNRALCKGEILNNKNAELPSFQTGLIAYYNFNQGLDNSNNSTVTSLTDLSGNANNGTLNNFALSGTTSNWMAPGAVISGSVAPTYTLLSASAVVSATTICANALATVTISATGGTAAYSGVGTYTTNTAVNSYTVSDVNNCVATATVNIIVNTLPNVTVNSGVICNGQSFTMVPTGANTYTYSNGTNVVTPTVNTSYTVTGTDINGCNNMAISSVTVDALPTLSVNNATICSGNTATLNAISSGSSVNWYASPTSTNVLASGNSYSLSPVASSTVYVQSTNGIASTATVGLLNNSGGGGQQQSTNFNIFDALTNFTLTSVEVYPGSVGNVVIDLRNSSGTLLTSTTVAVTSTVGPVTIPVNFAISAGTGYQLGQGAGSVSLFRNSAGVSYPYTLPGVVSITNSAAGSSFYYFFYKWTVSSFNGTCSSTMNPVAVTVNTLPSISVNSGSICAGQSFTMVPAGATTYTYSNGTDVVTPTANDSYTVSGTDANGCENTAVSSVTVNTLPVITSQSGNVTLCGDVSSTHSVSVAGTNTYEWYYTEIGGTDDGVINGSYTEINYTTNIMTIQQVLTGDYNGYGVYCIITNSNNCSVTSLIDTIVANPTPTVIVNSGAICAGQSFTMVPSGAVTYTYSNGTDIVTPFVDATYSVSGTDANGCVSNVDAVSSVTVNALPTVLAVTNSTLLCTGQTATLSVTGASTYTWNTAETTTGIAVSPTTTTVYTVTGTDANGCQNTTTIQQNVSLCTGINQIVSSTNSISVYPNPSTGIFVVAGFETGTKLEVVNVIGEVVYRNITTDTKTNINLSNESNGVYFIKTTNGFTYKIVKQN